MSDIYLIGRGLRGESYADILRRSALFGVTSTSTDAQVMQLLKDDLLAYAEGTTNFRGTLAEGVADFVVGKYFSSAESGSLRLYKRTGTTPFYVDQGDAAAPLSKALLASATGATLVGFKRSESGAVQRLASDKFKETPTWYDFGAIGDGTVHTVAEWIIPGALGRFANLAALQVQYPHVASTSDTIDWAAAQAAVDAAIYGGSTSNLGHKALVRTGAGHFKINRHINLGYGTDFSSVHIEGEGMAYAGSSAFNGTIISTTATVGMIFAVQGCRHATIRAMTLIGLNKTYLESGAYGTSGGPVTDLVAANWVDPALPSAASARYSPYAAIVVDPYCGTAPGVPYPTVSYPAFLGSVNQYGKNASSGVVIEDVNIEGFVVAVAAKPCNADGNAEYVKIIRPLIRYCQYAFSIGHTQSRLFEVTGGAIFGVHTAFVTNKHGIQNGKASITVIDTEIGGCIKWVDIPTMSLGGPPIFIGCYGEQVYSIGNAAAATSDNSVITFKNCEFQFGLQQYRGVPKYVFEWGAQNGAANFEGCRFTSSFSGYYGFFGNGGTAKSYRFSDCSFVSVQESAAYRMFALNSTGGVFVNRMAVDFTLFDVSANSYNLDTLAFVNSRRITQRNTGARPFCLPAATQIALPSAARYDGGVPTQFFATSSSKGSTPTVSGRIVTWDTGLTGNEWAIAQRGLGVGCTIFDEQTEVMFVVKARTAGVLTLEAMSGFNSAGNLITTMTSAGAMWSLNALTYTPTLPLFADTVDNNAVATNVSDGTGIATFITTDIVVNDYVLNVSKGPHYLGDANRSQITARDATARTITVNGEWKRTATFRRIPILLRAEAPNG